MSRQSSQGEVPVIRLSNAPGAGESWDKPRTLVYLWSAIELLFVSNPWQFSSYLRTMALKAFGAQIGGGVVFRPRTRVRFPWKLHIGNDCWIGEGVWLHNQDHIYIGDDVTISQDTFVTTGSHAYRQDMALLTRPIHIESGAWITSRCIVLGGSHVGRSAVITPGTVVSGEIPPNTIWGSNTPPTSVGLRFESDNQ